MKLFLVRIERDGKLRKEGHKTVSDVLIYEYRYAAETFQEVYDQALLRLINDDELLTIHVEHSAIFMINSQQGDI